MRKPDYFLAIYLHCASSFDKPTPEGSKVLWCLTTGKVESGYECSLRFFMECRKMGYPIVYKAIPAEEVKMIPAGFRMAISTKQLADIWKKQ